MDPVKQMMDEHRVIERAVDVLEKILDGLEFGKHIPSELIMADIGMLMECSDEYHRGKEEGILLPYLEKVGKTELKTPLQSLIDKHASSRQYLTGIMDVMETYDNGDRDAVIRIMQNGREYIQQIRSQIKKEDEEIFKALKHSLSEDELAELEQKIQDYEYSWNKAVLSNYQKIVRELERKASLAVW